MIRTLILASVLLVAASAQRFEDFENNVIEFDDFPQQFSIPYAYRTPDNGEQKIEAIKPVLENNYGTEVFVPGAKTVAVSKLGVLSSIVLKAFAFIKKVIKFFIVKGPALSIGSLVGLAICKFTSLCTKFSGVKSILEVSRQIRSIATPERMSMAGNLLQKAWERYEASQ